MKYDSKEFADDEYIKIQAAYDQSGIRSSCRISKSAKRKMEAILYERKYAEWYHNSQPGLVHGDFFYENILCSEGEITGDIDFGDVYYGYPVTDMIIGSMEFSILEGEFINFDLFSAFLRPFRQYIIDQSLDAIILYDLLLLNCIKFASYTFEMAQETDDGGNMYVKRFLYFGEDSIRQSITDTINRVLDEQH